MSVNNTRTRSGSRRDVNNVSIHSPSYYAPIGRIVEPTRPTGYKFSEYLSLPSQDRILRSSSIASRKALMEIGQNFTNGMGFNKRKSSEELAPPSPKRQRQNHSNVQKQNESSAQRKGLSSAANSPVPYRDTFDEHEVLGSPLLSPLSASVSQVSTPSPVRTYYRGIDQLISRIQECIHYMRDQQKKGDRLLQTTRFIVSTVKHSAVLALLRRYGTLITASDTREIHELGCPRPDWVTAGIVTGLHDPQWWVGKGMAEIKTGPYAVEGDVKRAAAHLKGLQTKKNKKQGPTAREKEIAWKLKEGLRRQTRGLNMSDDAEGETSDSEDVDITDEDGSVNDMEEEDGSECESEYETEEDEEDDE